MGYVDRTLTCEECGTSFTFGASEQEFYAGKGFTNDPKRCPECRQARKQQRSGSGQSFRTYYDAVCASCGQECRVPFEPREGRPVYCSACFSKNR